MSEKTIALSGAEVKVTFSGGNAWLRNDGASAVYAAKTAGITAGADGVISIPAGGSAPVYGANGTVFLLGSGSVQLIGSDYATNPFVGDSFGGGAGTSTNAAGIVTLDGLQGGVPFSEMVISGDDIVDQEIKVNACGKNLIPYPYYHTTFTANGVTFTDNGDGSITANGTATDNVVFYCSVRTTGKFYLARGNYFISGNTAQNARIDVVYTDTNGNAITAARDNGNGAGFTLPYNAPLSVGIVAFAGNDYNNAVIRPQIEIGSEATSYEPYSGSVTTITPDSNPYTVPNDIRQQDGINNVSVSAGEVTVTGAKKNAALKSVWDKLDELTAAIIVSNGEI